VRTLITHITVFIRKRTTKSSKVFSLNARIRVEAFTVYAVLGCRTVGDLRICTMTAKLMGVINPPAHTMLWVVARILIRASTYLTNSVRHNRRFL